MDTTQPNTTEPSSEDLTVKAPESEYAAVETPQTVTAESASDAAVEAQPAEAPSPAVDKKRIEEQLEALKRKELELRRALALADHPALAEAVRRLDGLVFSLTRVERIGRTRRPSLPAKATRSSRYAKSV